MKRIREDGKIVRGKGKRPNRKLINRECPVCGKPVGAARACPEHKPAVRMGTHIPPLTPAELCERRKQLAELDRQADESRKLVDEMIDRFVSAAKAV